MCLQAWLVVVGLAFDVGGIALVAAEDVAPGWVWTRQTAEEFGRRARARLRRRRPSPQTVQIEPATEFNFAGAITPVTSPGSESAPADRIDFLQRQLAVVEAKLRDVERQLEQLKDEQLRLAREFETRVDALIGAALTASKARYVRLRRVGIGFLVAGAALLAIANLV